MLEGGWAVLGRRSPGHHLAPKGLVQNEASGPEWGSGTLRFRDRGTWMFTEGSLRHEVGGSLGGAPIRIPGKH